MRIQVIVKYEELQGVVVVEGPIVVARVFIGQLLGAGARESMRAAQAVELICVLDRSLSDESVGKRKVIFKQKIILLNEFKQLIKLNMPIISHKMPTHVKQIPINAKRVRMFNRNCLRILKIQTNPM